MQHCLVRVGVSAAEHSCRTLDVCRDVKKPGPRLMSRRRRLTVGGFALPPDIPLRLSILRMAALGQVSFVTYSSATVCVGGSSPCAMLR